MKNMVEFTEIFNNSAGYDAKAGKVINNFSLRSVFLNNDYVVSVRENSDLTKQAQRESLIEGLQHGTVFSRVSVATPGQAPLMMNLVGTPELIAEKLNKA
mgnify:CR=1 FL=1